MKLELYIIFAATFFMFVTCTGPNARGESNRISRFDLNTSSMQEKEKMKYALGIIGLPNESDITQYSVADLGRLKNMRIVEAKRKVEQASQFLLKCLVETIKKNIENAVEDQFTFSNQQFTATSHEKRPDVSQPIAVGSNFVQTNQLDVTQPAQQGSSFSGNVVQHQVSSYFIGPSSSIAPSSSDLLPHLTSYTSSGLNSSTHLTTHTTTQFASSGNEIPSHQNTNLYAGPIFSMQLPPQMETVSGIHSSVQQIAVTPSSFANNCIETPIPCDNSSTFYQSAATPSNFVENFIERGHSPEQANTTIPSVSPENYTSATPSNFVEDSVMNYSGQQTKSIQLASTTANSLTDEIESDKSGPGKNHGSSCFARNRDTSFSAESPSLKSSILEEQTDNPSNSISDSSNFAQPDPANSIPDSCPFLQRNPANSGLRSQSTIQPASIVPQLKYRNYVRQGRKRSNRNNEIEHNSQITRNEDLPENSYVTLEVYLTNEEARLNKLQKEFTYNLDSFENYPVTLNLHCTRPFEEMQPESMKVIIRNSFRSLKPENLTFRKLNINYYYEKHAEYISKKHYFSRLNFSSNSGNDLLTASQKCSDIFIIKVSLDESKTGFFRTYNLHKYGLFNIVHGPVVDNTFLVSTEFDFCALVIYNEGSVFDFKKLNNPTPIISFKPILSDHHISQIYYGDIMTYNHPPKPYEIPNLIWIPHKMAAEGFTFTKPGIESQSQVTIKPGYALRHPEGVVAYRINISGIQTKYNVIVDKSPDLIRAFFYEPLKAHAAQYQRKIGYGDFVFVFQKQESTFVMLLTANDGKGKFVLTIPPLSPNFYFVKGLGEKESDYLVIHVQ